MKLLSNTLTSILLAVTLFMCLIQYPVRAGNSQSHSKVHAFYNYVITDKITDHPRSVAASKPKALGMVEESHPQASLEAATQPHETGYYPDPIDNRANSYSEQSTAKSTKYIIIVTGGELLSGVYPDGHTYFITKILRPLGLECVGSMSVDDKQADLVKALRYATDNAKLVIVTGGLGPTDNDITRKALCDFTKITLNENTKALQEMARRFQVSPDKLRANLRRQTQVPTKGTYFRNTEGTAVGLVFDTNDAVIIALPGPPRELQAMVRNELVPYLSRRFGTRLPGCSLTLRFVGLGQSQIDQTLEDNVPLEPDIIVSSQFDGSRVDFTFSLPEDTPQERTRLLELKKDIMKHLGEYIYVDDETSLEEHIIKLLKARGQTLALAGAGSGGTLTAALSNADGNREVLAGAYVAPTIEKLYRLVVKDNKDRTLNESDDQKIKQLAADTANMTNSHWAIAVSEAHRDQNGSGYVEVAFKLPDGSIESQKVRLRGTGELARSRLSTQLLDQLRRRLK